MIEGSIRLPVRHLTIRVPWHDAGWGGTFCKNCLGNTSCTVLPRIAQARDDAHEMALAGQGIEGLDPSRLPPCVYEHGTFMSREPLGLVKTHPYAESAKTTHGHFAKTTYMIAPHSAAAIPFRWMLRQEVEGDEKVGGLKEAFGLGYQAEREPDLKDNDGWKNDNQTWVQEGTNQRVLLDTFFSAAKPKDSLVFFYAKRTPLLDDPRRVIIGVGRVTSVGGPVEYNYVDGQRPRGRISGYLWERNVEHSIRPGAPDGFLLPYAELLRAAETDPEIDLAACTAFAPDAYFASYSYGTEHLEHDGAIASLLAVERAMTAMRPHLPDEPWDERLAWIDAELNRLWKVRGAFPGLGAALNAFGFAHGNLLAWHLTAAGKEGDDPWPRLGDVLRQPDTLPDYLRAGIGNTIRRKWESLPAERRALLMLIARFALSDGQATRWYQPTEREKAQIKVSDAAILANPYLVYEEDRLQIDPIAFEIIDRGVFPVEAIREKAPLPEPSLVREAIDGRRLRAVMITTLEEAAETEGHTCLPADWVIQRIRDRSLQPKCPVDQDALAAMLEILAPKVAQIAIGDGLEAFQLGRFVQTSELIRTKITKRRRRAPNPGEHDWEALVDAAIAGSGGKPKNDAAEKKAREEKTAALRMLFRSGVSALTGGAGTGKSTLLKALCGIESVRAKGILLLAPTGKARVRLEQTSGLAGQGKTVAQFLNKLGRYDGATGRYHVNDRADRSAMHATVIVDECSMLTEEQMAALLDALEGVDRLILVGDPRQLPPIGAGRPFVDVVGVLKPADEEMPKPFPRVASNFAELLVTRRQDADDGTPRDDVLLSQVFSGTPQDGGADEIWQSLAAGLGRHVKLVRWNDPGQLQALLLEQLKTELPLASIDDEVGFETSLGGFHSVYENGATVFFNRETNQRVGASRKAEAWQILSPVKQNQAGVTAINRALQQRFRKSFLARAMQTGWAKKIPSPMGPEGIIYGDKVINVVNKGNRKTWPEKTDAYVANGDIGIVVGQRKIGDRAPYPRELEVELASQPGFAYKYRPGEFSGLDSSPPLELAYALTVHKTQGSEFDKTFVVLPNPCRNLSREMLYTALTRQKSKIILLHQGDFRDLMPLSHETASAISRRMTTLFQPSRPVAVKLRNATVFMDEGLIYLTENGELVRSKSEWIIADKLKAAGIRYQYEQPVMLGGVERFPDFTIRDDDSDLVWYWEHNGMMSDPWYKKRWERKEAAYRKEGILRPSEVGDDRKGTLLVTEEGEGKSLDPARIQANIDLILGRS